LSFHSRQATGEFSRFSGESADPICVKNKVKNRSTRRIGFGKFIRRHIFVKRNLRTFGWMDGDQISDILSYIINMMTLVPLVPALLSFTPRFLAEQHNKQSQIDW
jgi:hypothetical protein